MERRRQQTERHVTGEKEELWKCVRMSLSVIIQEMSPASLLCPGLSLSALPVRRGHTAPGIGLRPQSTSQVLTRLPPPFLSVSQRVPLGIAVRALTWDSPSLGKVESFSPRTPVIRRSRDGLQGTTTQCPSVGSLCPLPPLGLCENL